jgi:hypothetical protein
MAGAAHSCAQSHSICKLAKYGGSNNTIPDLIQLHDVDEKPYILLLTFPYNLACASP